MGCAYLCSGGDFSGFGGVYRIPVHRSSESALVLFDSCIHLCMFLSFHISLEMLIFLFDCFAGFLSSVVWFPID